MMTNEVEEASTTSDEVEPATRLSYCEDALRDELMRLWGDFDTARRTALVRNLSPTDRFCGWSMHMADIADRIEGLTRLVGPTPWDQIQVWLLEPDGWYDEIHRAMGLHPFVDYERAAALRFDILSRAAG